MMSTSLEHRTSSRGYALRAALVAVLLAGVCTPVVAHAESPAVAALVKQAQYWRSKGREDLAEQAMRRARALDPQAKLVASAPKPAPAPSATGKSPAPRTPAAVTPMPLAPRQVAAAAYAPPAKVRGGQARAAGFDALEDDNLTSAASQFEKALGANRNDAEALGGLGLVRLRQERFGEAHDLLQQASRLGKADQWSSALASARFYAGVEEGRRLLAQGRVADAQAEAEALVRSGFAEPAPALELLAQVYEKQGRYADSADFYRQASMGGKQDATRLELRAIRSRALAAAQAGDELRAQTEFQSGLVTDPTDPWIRYEFARYMIGRGRVPEAESLLRSLEALGSADALYAAALLDNQLGRGQETARLLAMIPQSQQTAPMRALAIGVKVDNAIARAKAMGQGGGQMQALTSLRQIAATEGLPAGQRVAVADAMLTLGDAAGAVTLAQGTLGEGLSAMEDYEGLVDLLARAGREDLARIALGQAGQLAGPSPEGQRALARMNAKLAIGQAERARGAGRFADAFDILQAAWTSAPDSAEVLPALARLYQAGNMPGRAAQTWQLFLARTPGDRDALLGLAEAAQGVGDKSMSEKAQSQVIAAFPSDYEVMMRMAKLEQARGDERAALSLFKRARALYAGSGSGALASGNPFAATGPGNGDNPFRNMAAPAPVAPAQVNPFMLGGNGTRIEAAPSYAPAGYAQPGYPQTSYGQAQGGYPAAGYQPASYPAPAVQAPAAPLGSAGGYYPPVAAQSVPMADYAGQPMQSGPVYSSDPVMNELQGEIAELSRDNAPRVDVKTSFRQRSGEKGLSELSEIKGSARVSTGALGGRVYAGGEAVMIDAGRPSNSARARFGTNASPEARAIVAETDARDCNPSTDPQTCLAQVDSQNASGVALSVGYESDLVQAEVGTTPIGMGKTKLTFHAGVNPRIGNAVQAKAFVERQPVTDSVVSYAGATNPVDDPLDPVSGERWGQVMRTAAGGGLSYDKDGSGVYGEGRYYRFKGTNVADNEGFEINVGGYLRAYKGPRSSLTMGLNVNYQGYDNNQNTFTFGNGGYFSPKSFLSVGLPVNYAFDSPTLEIRGSFTPGFQSYREDASQVYPTLVDAQGELDLLKAGNNDVRAGYDSFSKTGFALNAQGSVYYRVGGNTQVGGDFSYNTFGSYDELRSMIGVRQSFGN